MKYTDVFNDLIYVYPISKVTLTDIQFNEELKGLSNESPIATPLYQVEFKKALTPIRKYYFKLVANTTTKFLNEIIEESKKDKIDVEYEYTFKSIKSRIEQYFHFIREHISNNQLTEDVYQTATQNRISDEAYVIHFMKYNCIMLYMELQERFKEYIKIETLEIEEVQETYLYEEASKESIIVPYDGPKTQYVTKTSEKVFYPIKGDLTHREYNNKILDFETVIKRPDALMLIESKLNEYEIIDNNYNFIPNKEKSNKQTLAATILKMYQKGYFNERRYSPTKPINDRDITKFFAHRYGNNSDTNKEFRNFKSSEKIKYNKIVNNIIWLDQIT